MQRQDEGSITPTYLIAPAPGISQPVGRRVLFNAGALAGSNLWRIGLTFVLQLFIARRLGVEGLGHYTVALAYLNVSQVISELGLPTLLVRDLAQLPSQRRSYFYLSLWAQTAAAFLVWGALVGLTFALPFNETTRPALWLAGASLPFYAVTSACQTIFQAGERMELLMGVEVFINILIVAASLAVLWRQPSVLSLVGVLVATQAVSGALCWFLMARARLLAAPGPKDSPRADAGLIDLWRRARPFFSLAIADVLLQRMDILLLGFIGGEIVTGIYSAAYNLVRVLVKLVQSFWRAVYPTLSRLHHQGDAKYARLAGLSLRYGLAALLGCAAIITGVASEVMHIVYSQGYVEATPVLQWLVWLAPLFLIEMYGVTLLLVERRPGYSVTIILAHLLVMALALPPLTLLAHATGAAWAVTAAGATGALASLVFLRRLRVPLQIGNIAPMGVAAALTLATSLLTPVSWPLRLLLGGALYSAILLLTGTVAPADWQLLRKSLRMNGA